MRCAHVIRLPVVKHAYRCGLDEGHDGPHGKPTRVPWTDDEQ